MEKVLRVLSVFTISLVLVFTSCEKKDTNKDTKISQTTDISLKCFEPEVIVKGGGDKEDYRKVVVEELVKKEECKWEVVSGIIEYYYQDEMVFSINFGNGQCDGVATISWLENETIESKVVDVWKLFLNGTNDKDKKYFVIEELVKSEECDYEIVSGIIEYQDKSGNPYVTIDFGNGECDGIATKCRTKEGVTECDDFNVDYWGGKFKDKE